MSVVGWIGAVMLALCGIPQAVLCWRLGNADALSWGFLTMWFGGEVLTLVYVLSFQSVSYPLLFNYSFNIAALLVIFRYKVWPRNAIS